MKRRELLKVLGIGAAAAPLLVGKAQAVEEVQPLAEHAWAVKSIDVAPLEHLPGVPYATGVRVPDVLDSAPGAYFGIPYDAIVHSATMKIEPLRNAVSVTCGLWWVEGSVRHDTEIVVQLARADETTAARLLEVQTMGGIHDVMHRIEGAVVNLGLVYTETFLRWV